MPTITLTNSDGSFDISGMVDSVTWSGEYRSCARSLDFGLVSSPDDPHLPEVDCSVGCSVVVEQDGKTLFNGFVFDRTKSTGAVTIDVSCLDRGIYLNRNKTSKKLTATPEAATRALCGEFGIAMGSVATTDVTVKRKFLGSSIYEIISTMYTEAARTTGAAYHIGFDGDKLTVRTKGTGKRVLLIKGGSNLMTATVSESGKNIVNQVMVCDKDGNKLYSVNNQESISSYGTMQEVIRQVADADPMGDANKLLEASEVVQKITVENVGDIRCVTGSAVMLEESYTGLYGLFYIEADTHTWKNGLYFNKLTLNLKAVMDEKSAGELLGETDSDKITQMVQGDIAASKKPSGNFRVDRLEEGDKKKNEKRIQRTP